MKAMDRVSRGKGFRGLLDYLSGRDDPKAPPGRLIGGSMAAVTVARLASEYRAVAKLRPDIKKPVWHQALRLPAGDVASDERWNEIVHEYLRLLGLDPDKFQYTVWIHDDEGAVHIAANRVAPDGVVYLGQNENLKSTRITQSLEKSFGLTVTKGPDYDWSKPTPGVTPKPTPALRRKPKHGEQQVIEQTGLLSARQQLQEILDAALLDKPSLLQFVQRLAAWNVCAIPNLASTGTMNGFSFLLDGVRFKASGLGSLYRWSELKHHLAHHAGQDRRLLERLRDSKGMDVPNESAPIMRPASPAPKPSPWTIARARTEIETLISAVLETRDRNHVLDTWDVAVGPESQWIEFTTGHHRVVAYADRIEAANGDDDEIAVMLDLARLRGWTRLTFSGDARFKLAAMTVALQGGFDVTVIGEADTSLLNQARRSLVEPMPPHSDIPVPPPSRPRAPRP